MNKSLIMGTLDLLILDVLARERSYGYLIAQAVLSNSKGTLDLKEGSLYPALHRMQRQGWLKAEWEHAPEGRRRKYYRLTLAGRRELERRRDEWQRFADGIEGVLGARYAVD